MGIVPFTVELGAVDVDGGHLGVGYDNASGYWGCRVRSVQIPMKPAGYSDLKAATIPI